MNFASFLPNRLKTLLVMISIMEKTFKVMLLCTDMKEVNNDKKGLTINYFNRRSIDMKFMTTIQLRYLLN